MPQIRIDTAYRFIKDTVCRIETDSILIETTVHDSTIRQRIETKPLYITVRDTVFDTGTATAKAENKRLKAENETANKIITRLTMVCMLAVPAIAVSIWASRRKRN